MALLEVTLNQISRLVLPGSVHTRSFMTQGGPLTFRLSQLLSHDPPRKKKRIDSHLVMVKEIKRKNRIERQIKKLELKERILKPVSEISGERNFRETLHDRQRETPTLSFEEAEKRAMLLKDWCRYKAAQHSSEMRLIHRAKEARERAMKELRLVSEELYIEALKIDPKLMQYAANGPVHTPSIQTYMPPDGEIKNTTRLFQMEKPHSSFPIVDHKLNKFT